MAKLKTLFWTTTLYIIDYRFSLLLKLILLLVTIARIQQMVIAANNRALNLIKFYASNPVSGACLWERLKCLTINSFRQELFPPCVMKQAVSSQHNAKHKFHIGSFKTLKTNVSWEWMNELINLTHCWIYWKDSYLDKNCILFRII